MIAIKTQLIKTGTKRRSGVKMGKVGFYVDHDTGNAGSTAQNNVDYFCNTADEDYPSAHAFIDDIGVIICIPCTNAPEKAHHVLYNLEADNKKFGDDANDIAIGLELCYFPNDKARSLKAYQNYIFFSAFLAKYHGNDPEKRVGHFELDPSRKTDPQNALSHIGKKYAEMKADILAEYKIQMEVKPMSEQTKPVKATNDVSDWAKKAQEWAMENNITDGTRPHDPVTRQELWVMLQKTKAL